MAPRKRKAAEAGIAARKKSKNGTDANPVPQLAQVNTTNADPASQTVLATTELVEQIILNLSFKQVFVLQGVSTWFRDVIQDSVAIRRKQFLQPSTKHETWKLQYVDGKDYFASAKDTHIVKPDLTLVAYERPKESHVPAQRVVADQTQGTIICITPLRLNPLLRSPRKSLRRLAESLRRNERSTIRIEFDMSLSSTESWRNTLITDPPCTSATLHLQWSLPNEIEYWGSLTETVSDSDGLTLGKLVDATLKSRRSHLPYVASFVARKAPNATLEDVLSTLHSNGREAATSKRRSSEGSESTIVVRGIVLPTEQQWEDVERSRGSDSQDNGIESG